MFNKGLDTPSDSNYIENLIAGLTVSDCALLVVSAIQSEFDAGIPKLRDQAMFAFQLGIKQVIVVVNKIDRVDWSEDQFKAIGIETITYLKKIGFEPRAIPIIPISGLTGDNLLEESVHLP